MMRNDAKAILSVAALSVAITAVAPPTGASAQEIQITGPLAGQPAVRRMRQYRIGRVQVTPTLGYTLQDEFARHLMVGLEANVHFLDFLGVGVWGAMANFGNALHIDTDLTAQVRINGQTTARNRLSMPSPDGFPDQVARLQGVASVHLLFAPLRGKLALFQGAFVDTDFYVLGGFALAFVEERADAVLSPAAGQSNAADCNAPGDPCLATQRARKSRLAPTAMVGVGLNLYFNEWMGLAIQWRAFPFNMNPAGTDESGGSGVSSVSIPDQQINDADQRFYFHHLFNIGLVISLPPQVQVTD